MSTEATPAAAAERSDDLATLRGVEYAVDGKPVFRGLDIGIRRGEVTAIMGPSGTGKTTLLRLITGQLRADRGVVLVDGRDVGRMRRNELYALRRRMGMLFQNGALLTDLDVFENVAFPLREHTDLPERLIRNVVLTKLHAVGLRGAARLMPQQLSGGMGRRVALARAIAMDPDILIYDEPFAGLDPISMGVVVRLIRNVVLTKLHAVGLRGAASLMPQQLSGGMGRRVALARAIAMDPDILIYDEPFAGLDPISMGVVLRLIRQLNDALGLSSVVVTHDVQEISRIADTSYILSEGRVVAKGSADALERNESPIVRQFVGGHADGPVSFHYPAPDYREQLLGQETPT